MKYLITYLRSIHVLGASENYLHYSAIAPIAQAAPSL